MSLTFAISAPQVITLPDGTQLSFRVNPADTSLVELHIVGVDGNDVPGTHVLTFKRNGGPNDTSFVPTTQINEQPAYANAPSVDKDAVREPLAGDTFAPAHLMQPPNSARDSQGNPVDTKPAA